MRKEWLETDYYQLLGVPKDATQRDIKKAYRKLAQEYHPDKNPNNGAAEARFKEINEAYEILGNDETRKEYDGIRDVGYFVGGPGGDQQYVRIEDFLSGQGAGRSPLDVFGGLTDLFAGSRRTSRTSMPGRDLRTEIGLTFFEAIAGVTKQITAEGQTLKVKIPRGVEDGANIRLRGKGARNHRGEVAGDLYVTISVGKHPLYERAGRDLKITVPITFVEAILGADVDIPTLDGKVRLRVPPGTASGKAFKVTGRGIEGADSTRGDLLVTVEVQIPTALTEEQTALLKEYRDNGPVDNPRTHLGM